MPLLAISAVARQLGLRPSAIRYYEQVGILTPAQRIGGQRRYDETVLYRLAVIKRAQQIGFTLDEIRQLFYGFRTEAPPSERWKKLSQRKLVELDQLMEGIKTMQSLLQRSGKCHCVSLDECGKGLLRNLCGEPPLATAAKSPRKLRSNRY